MDEIPDFKSTEDNPPFNIDTYLENLRVEYNEHLNGFIKIFKHHLERGDKKCEILVHQDVNSDSILVVPMLKEKAALYFVWMLRQKKYPCEYIVRKKEKTVILNEHWSEIQITLIN